MSQKKYSLLYPNTNAQYRTLSDVTMHDLGMDQICKKLSAKEREQNYIQNVMARLYADPAVTQYRCDIFEDVLQQKKMRDDLMEILERISFLREYGSFNREYDESACIWDLLHRLDELNDYIKCVDALHTCLAASDIHSAGFLGLKAYVEKIYADNGFAELKKDISELKMDTSQLKSITVGINLNDRFEADGIGLISVNSKYFTKSGILGNFYDHIASKDRINEDTIWKKNFKFQPFDVNADAVISTSMQKVMDTAVMRSESRGGIVKLPEGDQAKDVTRYTDRIVNHMISHMVKRVREVLNKYVSITITDMTDLIPELLYYIKWAEYIQKLQEQGFTFAKASVYKEGENESDPYVMQARGIYNLKLAVFETEESGNIVPNDMDFDRNRRVIGHSTIIGRSNFLQISFCLHLLYSSGDTGTWKIQRITDIRYFYMNLLFFQYLDGIQVMNIGRRYTIRQWRQQIPCPFCLITGIKHFFQCFNSHNKKSPYNYQS